MAVNKAVVPEVTPDGVLDADVVGVRLFELQHLGVLAPPAERILRLQHIDQFLLLDVVVELRSVGPVVECVFPHRRSPVDGQFRFRFAGRCRHSTIRRRKDRRGADGTHRFQEFATVRY